MLQTLQTADKASLAKIAEEKKLRKTSEVFLLFPLGSQFDLLIKQRLDKLGVYCLVADPATVTADDVRKVAPKGIILSGGPASIHQKPPPFDCAIFDIGIPVFGICLGFQLWAAHLGHKVVPAAKCEFGMHILDVRDPMSGLFLRFGSRMADGVSVCADVLESHGDRIERGNENLHVIARTENAPIAAAVHKHLWGVQFHPEVSDTQNGDKLFENFCFVICDAKDRFPAKDVVRQKCDALNEQLLTTLQKNGRGEVRVLIALSGGVDSSVVAHLLETQVGKVPLHLRGVYIKGIDRADDESNVRRHFGALPWLELKVVDATTEFLAAVAGKRSMHHKRLAMRGVYQTILDRELHLFDADFIAQGTLYTDISESGGGLQTGADKAQIKLHHNIDLKFIRPELTPLADQVKDGARQIGRALRVPEAILLRHPFPGPGLLVRIENKVRKRKLHIAYEADKILIEELKSAGLYSRVWQTGARVLASHTTTSRGDGAGRGCYVELFAVTSVNGFTAQVAELPWDFIRKVSRRITNEIEGVGRVVYNCSDKPPATIEMG